MEKIPIASADDWAIPDDAGFEEIKARFKKNRKKKRRRTLLAILLLCALAWTPIIVSVTNKERTPLTFANEPLDAIIIQIEHQYNIDIDINDEQLKRLQFSGTFRQERPEKILNALSRSLKFTWTKSGAQQYVIAGANS